MGICFNHPECCDGHQLAEDSTYNKTFAITHRYCYPAGEEPPLPSPVVIFDNVTNTTTIYNPIIYNESTSPPAINWSEVDIIKKKIQEEVELRKYLFVTMPLKLSKITGGISIFCSMGALLIFTGILIYQPIIAKRCSLRLSVAVTFSDMIFSFCQSIDSNEFNDYRCTTSAILQAWSELLSLFFTCMIALNLLLVFVFDFSDTKRIEPLYYILPIVLATSLLIYPWYRGWFGWDFYNCFFRYDNNVPVNEYYDALYKIEWAFYTSWMVASIIWCAVVTALFWFTLERKNQRKNRNIGATGTTSTTSNGTRSTEAKGSASGKGTEASSKIQQHSQALIQKAVIRIAWYPVVPLVTALPLALSLSVPQIAEIYQFTWFAAIMCNLQGFGNACIFYFDPAVALARETFRKSLSDKYVLKYHPITEDGSRAVEALVMNPAEQFMYTIIRFVSTRKRDFVVEVKKGKSSKATFTKSTQGNDTKILKSAPVDSNVGQDSTFVPPTASTTGYDAYSYQPQQASSFTEQPPASYSIGVPLIAAADESLANNGGFNPLVQTVQAGARDPLLPDYRTSQIELQIIPPEGDGPLIVSEVTPLQPGEQQGEDDDEEEFDDAQIMQTMNFL